MIAARRLLLAVTLPVALAVTGCAGAGGDSAKDFKGEQRKVAQAVEDFQDAATKRDEGQICSRYLAATLVDRMTAAGKGGGGSCADQLKDSLRDVDTFGLDVKKVVISGATATATVKSEAGKNDRLDTLSLVKEGTPLRWKISALAGG